MAVAGLGTFTRTHVGRPRPVDGSGPTGPTRPLRDAPRMPVPVAPAADAPSAAVPDGDADGSRSRTAIVVAALAVLAVSIATLVVASRGDHGPGVGEAFVDVHGTAVVHRPGHAPRTVHGRVDLEPGHRLVLTAGTADLELADHVTYQAVARHGSVPGTDLTMGRRPVLNAGPLLIDAPDGAEVAAGAGPGVVRIGSRSVVRLTRTAAVRVGVYAGSASVSSAGLTRPIPALRSADLVGAGEVTGVRPLTYRDTDRWDRLHLAPAIGLDRELSSLLAGLRTGPVVASTLVDKVRLTLPDPPDAARVRRLAATRRSSYSGAIGVAVAGHADRSFERAWRQAVTFHDDGAAWGLAAMEVGADPDAVIDSLLAAVEATPPVAVAGAAELPEGPVAPGSTVPPAVDAPVASTVPAPTPTGPGPDTTPTPGPTAPPPPPAGPTVPALPVQPGVTVPPVTTPVTTPSVLAPLDPVVGDVTGVVGGTVGTVGEVLDPVTGLLLGPGGLLGPGAG